MFSEKNNYAKTLEQLRGCIARGDLAMTDRVKVVGNNTYIGFYPIKKMTGSEHTGVVVSVAELLQKLESVQGRTR